MKFNFLLRIWMVHLLLIAEAFAKFEDRHRKRHVPETPIDAVTHNDITNLCRFENSQAHCVCLYEGARCHIIQNLSREHELWKSFSTQPLIKSLDILVSQISEVGQLTYIPTEGLQHLKELASLTILYGNIKHIHPYAFANLTKLTEITLTRNQITTLSDHAFAHLINLLNLDLNENVIAELKRDVFVDLPNLENLFLKQNNLSVIQDGAFKHLGHLRVLELSVNGISTLTKDSFAGLGELKELSLAYNKITKLEDLIFAELWVLEDLDLEGNQLNFISARAFAALKRLRRLNLSHNRLKELEGAVLSDVPAVVNLDLRYNYLETLTEENVQAILPNFFNESGYFYITDNNFICDCRLSWVYVLRNKTRNSILQELIDNSLKCRFYEIPANLLRTSDAKDTPSRSIDPNYSDYTDDYYYVDEEDYQEPGNLQNLHNINLDYYLIRIPIDDLPCEDESKDESKATVTTTTTQTPIQTHKIHTVIETIPDKSSKVVFSTTMLLLLLSVFWF